MSKKNRDVEIDNEIDNEDGDSFIDNYNITSDGSDSGDGIPILDTEIAANVGWICPICHYGISPYIGTCPCHD